jgi:hypothetical protein
MISKVKGYHHYEYEISLIILKTVVSNYKEFKKFLSERERVILWVNGKTIQPYVSRIRIYIIFLAMLFLI